MGFRNYDKETGLLYYFFDNIYNGCLTVFIAGILWLLEKYGLIESQKQQLEIERNQAQIQSLKTQINPHF
ncbi:MAG: histidine kinase, partial [Chryseobacterium sp.]|nr:histidine kinase [Candidatus Chryseobacterium enterohippi]